MELPEGWEFVWEHEEAPDLSWCDDLAEISETLCVRLVDDEGRTRASLGNVSLGFNTRDNRAWCAQMERELLEECIQDIAEEE